MNEQLPQDKGDFTRLQGRKTRQGGWGYDMSRSWRITTTIAILLLATITALWTFWGVAELYYEGWWGHWYDRLAYLVPAAAFLALSLLLVRWPRLGGTLLMLLGGGFTVFFLSVQIGRWGLRLLPLLQSLAVTAPLFLIGLFFFWAGRRVQFAMATLSQPAVVRRERRWRYRLRRFYRRHWCQLVMIGLPLLVVLVVSVYYLPLVLTRGEPDLGMQRIEGNGVTLVWAPAGPGWGRGLQTMEQLESLPGGAFQPGYILSWNDLARYGQTSADARQRSGAPELRCDATHEVGCATQAEMAHTGLCRYLSDDGTRLLDEPANIWRMPTAEELACSLTRDGANAGCTWERAIDEIVCRTTPDKEPPLWDPHSSAIYYWAGDERDLTSAYYVGYNGQQVHAQPKSYGNPRHGYRCVRVPDEG